MTKTMTSRKLLALLLTLAMVVSLCAGMTVSASAETGNGTRSEINAGANINAGGSYTIAADPGTGTITVSTTAAVTISGYSASTSYSGLSIDCTVAGVNLTISDLRITSPDTNSNVLGFTGAGNTLTLDGTSLFENDKNNGGGDTFAAIHVGSSAALSVAGSGTLYLYKNALGAGIGGDSGELNGAITFTGGNVFLKGSRMGAVVGIGSGASGTPGAITFSGGFQNIAATSNGAGVGGLSTSTVVLNDEEDNLAITCDFGGPAVKANTLTITAGSFFVTKTSNSDLATDEIVDASITDGTNGLIPFVYTPSNPADVTIIRNISVSHCFYNAAVNTYGFDRTASTTMASWVSGQNDSLYIYVPASTTSLFFDSGTAPRQLYKATFSSTNASAAAGDSFVAASAALTTGTLEFNAVPDAYHDLGTVAATAGTLSNTGDHYTLSGLTGNATVTLPATPMVFTVAYDGDNVDFKDAADGTAPATVTYGSSVVFKVAAHTGYSLSTVTASNGTLASGSAKYQFVLSNVTENTIITATTNSHTSGWDGNSATIWSSGSGSETNPYIIATAANLAYLRNQVNLGTNYSGIYFKQTADLNLNSYNWIPIGTSESSAFAGNYDGNGHSITALAVSKNTNYVGLFGTLAASGTIRNLSVSGSVAGTGSIDFVGGIVGHSKGVVADCLSNVAVTATSAFNVGGVVGFNDGYSVSSNPADVLRCGNTAQVSGGTKVGGIVGENAGLVSGCYNTGAIISAGTKGTGGIVGRNGNNNTAVETGVIENCFNTATINSNTGYWTGGITGFNNALSSVSNCYDTGNVPAYNYCNPIVGKQEGTVSNCFSLTGLNHSGSYISETGEIIGSDVFLAEAMPVALGTAWAMDRGSLNGGYPILLWQASYVVDGTAGVNGIGTYSSPFNSISSATSALNDGRYTALVAGKITVSSGAQNINLTGTYSRILRAPAYTGYLFEVSGTGSLTMYAGTIAGTTANSAVLVSGGTFTLTPSSSAFAIGEKIYLAAGKTITVNDYIDGITGYLTISCSDAAVGRVVANCAEDEIAEYGYEKFASSPSGMSFEAAGSQIKILTIA